MPKKPKQPSKTDEIERLKNIILEALAEINDCEVSDIEDALSAKKKPAAKKKSAAKQKKRAAKKQKK